MELLKRFYETLLVVSVWSFSESHGYEQNIANTPQEVGVLQNIIQKNGAAEKPRTLYDYQTRAVAYKDLIESRCFLEILTNEESIISQRLANSANSNLKPLHTSNKLSKREIWRLGGTRIYDFCRGFPTYLIQGNNLPDSTAYIQNDLPIVEISKRTRNKRDNRHYFVGKVRGQTQSQYLSFANNGGQPGKAEAESSFEGTKAVVTGTSGMGQAQSQSSPVDCGECLGPGYQGQELLYTQKPGQVPEKITRPEYPGYSGTRYPGGYSPGAQGVYQPSGEGYPSRTATPEGSGWPHTIPSPSGIGRPSGPSYQPGSKITGDGNGRYFPETGRPNQEETGYQPGQKPDESAMGYAGSGKPDDGRPRYPPGSTPGIGYPSGEGPRYPTGAETPGESGIMYPPESSRPGEATGYTPGARRPGDIGERYPPEISRPGGSATPEWVKPVESGSGYPPGAVRPDGKITSYRPGTVGYPSETGRPGESVTGYQPSITPPGDGTGYPPVSRPGFVRPEDGGRGYSPIPSESSIVYPSRPDSGRPGYPSGPEKPGEEGIGYYPGGDTSHPTAYPQQLRRPGGGSFGGQLTGQYQSHVGQSGRFSGTFQGTYETDGHGVKPVGPGGADVNIQPGAPSYGRVPGIHHGTVEYRPGVGELQKPASPVYGPSGRLETGPGETISRYPGEQYPGTPDGGAAYPSGPGGGYPGTPAPGTSYRPSQPDYGPSGSGQWVDGKWVPIGAPVSGGGPDGDRIPSTPGQWVDGKWVPSRGGESGVGPGQWINGKWIPVGGLDSTTGGQWVNGKWVPSRGGDTTTGVGQWIDGKWIPSAGAAQGQWVDGGLVPSTAVDTTRGPKKPLAPSSQSSITSGSTDVLQGQWVDGRWVPSGGGTGAGTVTGAGQWIDGKWVPSGGTGTDATSGVGPGKWVDGKWVPLGGSGTGVAPESGAGQWISGKWVPSEGHGAAPETGAGRWIDGKWVPSGGPIGPGGSGQRFDGKWIPTPGGAQEITGYQPGGYPGSGRPGYEIGGSGYGAPGALPVGTGEQPVSTGAQPVGQQLGPSGQPLGPGAQSSIPGGQPLWPGGPVGAAGKPLGPGVQTWRPGGQPSTPGGQPLGPDGQILGLGGQQLGPGGQPLGAGGQLLGQGGQQLAPSGQPQGPSGQALQPGRQPLGAGGQLIGPGGQSISSTQPVYGSYPGASYPSERQPEYAGPGYGAQGSQIPPGTPGYEVPGASTYDIPGVGIQTGAPGYGQQPGGPGYGPPVSGIQTGYGKPGETRPTYPRGYGPGYGTPDGTVPPGQYVQGGQGAGQWIDGKWVPSGTSAGQYIPSGGVGTGGQWVDGKWVAAGSEAITGDDADSQVQTSVQQTNNETIAKAQAHGKYQGGTSQSQVSGTYTGSGSFSASAGSDDGKRGALTQVSGGKDGAQSSAQGRGGAGQTQAQVTLDSGSGDTLSTAQSSGIQHGTQTEVRASEKGGLSDAQANGLGPTSSQAQIGFTPYDENEQDNQTSPFRGGGTAAAQSGTHTGMTQTQIQGKFRYGIKYQGAAQAGSGSVAIRNLTEPTGFFKPINFTSAKVNYNNSQSQSQQASVGVPVSRSERKLNIPTPAESPNISESNQEKLLDMQVQTLKPVSGEDAVVATSPSDTSVPEYEDYAEEDYEEDDEQESEPLVSSTKAPSRRNLELPKPAKPANVVSQSSDHQKQHIILDPLENLDATIHQSKGDIEDGMILQPGQVIPGSPGYQIPAGFRGKVKSIANGANTYAVGKHSQAQSVTLSPGKGRIIYNNPSNPIYGVVTKTTYKNGNYGTGYSYRPVYHPVGYRMKSGTILPNFVSISKSEAGSKDLRTGKKTPNVYYTQSSSCGMFTNSCVYTNGQKTCFPVRKTNPDGSPMSC